MRKIHCPLSYCAICLLSNQENEKMDVRVVLKVLLAVTESTESPVTLPLLVILLPFFPPRPFYDALQSLNLAPPPFFDCIQLAGYRFNNSKVS